MLDNYNELREGMLAQCDKPAFPDQYLYALSKSERDAELRKLEEANRRYEESKKNMDREFHKINRRYKKRKQRIYEDYREASKKIHNHEVTRPYRYIGAATGGAVGGVLAHKLSKRMTRNMKSAKAAKAVRAATTLAGIATGGYAGHAIGDLTGHVVDKRIK